MYMFLLANWVAAVALRSGTANGGDAKGNPDGSLEVFAALTPADQVVVVVMNRNENNITFSLVDSDTRRTTPTPLVAPAHSIQTLWYAANLH